MQLLQDKIMIPDYLYTIALMVKNPLSVQQEAQDWLLRSFRPDTESTGDETIREMDRANVAGFAMLCKKTSKVLFLED